jgi:DNA repair photolyase
MQLSLLSDLPERPPRGSTPLGGPLSTHGDEVVYREIAVRQVLCKSPGAERMGMPFAWTINPYRGCEIGCTYCYARYTHTYLGLEAPKAFEREIFVKLGAGTTVPRSLQPEHFAGAQIAIGTATDPYQPAERRYRITRGILQKLASFRGLTLSLTTKSPLVLDDLDLLARIARRSKLTVHMSLISLDPDLIRLLEPKSATPKARLEAIRQLTDAGIRTGLFLMPVIPGINDDRKGLAALEKAGRAAGAAFVVTQRMQLRRATWPVFANLVREHFPLLYAPFAAKAGRRFGTPPEGAPDPCPPTARCAL